MPEGEKQFRKFRHPGSGRRSTTPFPKGRQVDPQALSEIRALLGNRPRRRDLLIEHLHLIQDKYHCLSAAHLAALAEEMRMAQAEVYEVATFYAHFDVVLEDETPPPPLTVRVCDSLTCELMGAKQLLAALPDIVGREVRVIRAPCVGRCDTAPVAEVGHHFVDHATVANVAAAVKAKTTAPLVPQYAGLDAYRDDGGYRLLAACHAGERSVDDIVKLLDQAGLRGLGGAGFPAGRKWSFVRAHAAPRFLAVNIDEGEPGTFKDRWYLERDPHRFLEGMLIAAWAVGIDAIYVYLRDEYPQCRKILLDELAALQANPPAPRRRWISGSGTGGFACSAARSRR